MSTYHNTEPINEKLLTSIILIKNFIRGIMVNIWFHTKLLLELPMKFIQNMR